MKHRNLKGFTLVELIVVMALIAILAAVLAPTMSSYYRMAKLKAENANARMVYNAAQTEMQRYTAIDRVAPADSPFAGQIIVTYYDDGRITTSEGSGLESALAGITGQPNETILTSFVNEVNQTVSDGAGTNWAVYIDNYIVKACVSSDNPASNYVGRFSSNNSANERAATTTLSTQSFNAMMANGQALVNVSRNFYDQP